MFKFLKEKLAGFLKLSKEPEAKIKEKEKPLKKDIKAAKKEKPGENDFVKEKKPIKEELSEKNKEEIDYAIEQVEEEIKQVEKPKEEGFFAKLKSRIGTVQLNKEMFDEFFEKLEEILLENNVALSVIDKIRDDLEKDLVGIEIKKSGIEKEIKNSLKESLLNILVEPFDIISKIKEKDGVFVILFFGINGSGKTTTIAKFGRLLQDNKIPCIFAAADTFRAASIEQLKKHGERLGINVISQNYGADPAAVGFDAINYAKSHGVKAVLIDTAGRMHTKSNLLKEMEKIIRVTKPDLKIFVAESITGNDATEQAKTFNESFGIDGTILTKVDVDEKGGTAISIGHVTGKPILFLGTGQEYRDIQRFSPAEVLANLGLE